MYVLSKESIEMLKGVHPNLVGFMIELIGLSPHDFKITAGARTAEEQNKLYKQGRTTSGNIVTKADGYKIKSNHQSKIDGLGYAVDIGVLVKENGKIVYKGDWKDFHYYQDIYNVAKKTGLLEKYNVEWGGNCWKTFKDAPHWQIKGADKVAFKN